MPSAAIASRAKKEAPSGAGAAAAFAAIAREPMEQAAMVNGEERVDARALLAQTRKVRAVGDAVERADVLEYDLGAVSAFDPSPIDEAALKAGPEKWLAECARDCTQLLFNKLWGSLDEQDGSKVTIRLPRPSTALPREKPMPKVQPVTRWEKFAKEKGIVKKKRERMIYDENEEKWMPRYGYKRVNGDALDWAIPAKSSDKPGTDPFEVKATAKRDLRGRQLFNEERNRRAAKRTTPGGAPVAVPAAMPVGVPEMRAAAPDKASRLKRADTALQAAQGATASLGKFDRELANEPSKARGTKRKFDANLGADLAAEKTKGLKVLNNLLRGQGHSGIDMNKAARIGQLAHEKGNREARASRGEEARAAKGGKGGKGSPAGGKGGGRK
ncbi:ribosome biogenesis regulatory protein-domain-containing protein [Pavlovales sp. CCMP2436]|nr:ribosome biogenesis regulatory protein-domain-containing protein [Pavlovales sp. CCMP2436]